jgi:hypothetical protein
MDIVFTTIRRNHFAHDTLFTHTNQTGAACKNGAVSGRFAADGVFAASGNFVAAGEWDA